MKTKGTVLIVDHRDKETQALKKALEKQDFDVVESGEMADAVKIAGKISADVIVIHSKLEKHGGAVEVCRNYRREESKFRHVPILMMIDREDYAANSLFENPRWSPFEAIDGKPAQVKTILKSVEKTLNETLKDTFVILLGYYKEDKEASLSYAAHDGHSSKKSA